MVRLLGRLFELAAHSEQRAAHFDGQRRQRIVATIALLKHARVNYERLAQHNERAKLRLVVAQIEAAILEQNGCVIARDRDVGYAHTCVECTAYRRLLNFRVAHNMDRFDFLLLIDGFEDDV